MPDLELEEQLHKDGHTHVAGIDEAGRGPLAGPVVAGAVILPKDFDCPGLNDSKKLSAKKRDALYDVIINHPGLVWASAPPTVPIAVRAPSRMTMSWVISHLPC